MGAQQSRHTNNGNGNGNGGKEDGCPCFVITAPFQNYNDKQHDNNDLLGSPILDTPRIVVPHGRRSSKYMGLEKELAISNRSMMTTNTTTTTTKIQNGNQKNHHPSTTTHTSLFKPRDALDMAESQYQAQIHEGSNAEVALYDKYLLMEVLGVGSTSTCHRCVNKTTGIHYACKIIDKQVIEDRFQGMMEQFHTEIEALRSLHHPNIIQLFDVYITDEKIFFVMELMEGGELFDYVVQKGTLTEDEAASIVRNVTSALVYMHSKNIVHRDLKPENLLLRRTPNHEKEPVEIKIIDFGLSKCMEEPVARSFLGTRGYLAPEMLQRRDYTKAVDTWALGVIVFVLLCGCLPFDDDSATVPSDDLVRAKFVLRFPRWAKNLSSSAKDLLSHLLDVDPRRRYTAEQALDHPWVTGKAAPKGNLLASPGRIKKSPALRKSANRTPQSGRVNGKYYPPTTGRQQGPHHAVSPPQRVMVRKTSI